MASITKVKRENGTAYRIEFFDNGRKFIRLPTRYNERTAQTVKEVVERLLAIKENNLVIDKKTLAILEGLAQEIFDKLESVGLVGSGKFPSLGNVWKRYLSEWDGRKESTWTTYDSASRRFFKWFRPEDTADDITLERAQEWRAELVKQLAGPTVASTVARVRTVFKWAVKKGMAKENIFLEVEKGSYVNKAKEFYISMEDYKILIDACPCLEWRALLALCRIGGLRNPSETMEVKWADVDFNAGRVWVTSPKTERFETKEGRLIPLFPPLRAELEQLAGERQEGDIYVISRNRGDKLSMRYPLIKIISLSGLERWPRLFHNLRGSRSNELYREYPAPVAAYWLGHSPRTAMIHYLHPLESDYERAISGGTNGGTSGGETVENQRKPEKNSKEEQ